jgi:ribonuclease P protein component
VVRALPPAAEADSAVLGRELDGALKRLTGGGVPPPIVPTAERRS